MLWTKFVEEIKTHCSRSARNKQSKTLYLLHIYAHMLTILCKNLTNALTNANSGFGGLEVACWPLVPKFAGSHLAEAVGFLE